PNRSRATLPANTGIGDPSPYRPGMCMPITHLDEFPDYLTCSQPLGQQHPVGAGMLPPGRHGFGVTLQRNPTPKLRSRPWSALYFCPQLYKYDSEKKLVPLYGEEIGKLIAQALESGIKERRPWYVPSDDLPTEAAINGSIEPEFDTLVVDMPRRSSVAASA